MNKNARIVYNIEEKGGAADVRISDSISQRECSVVIIFAQQWKCLFICLTLHYVTRISMELNGMLKLKC